MANTVSCLCRSKSKEPLLTEGPVPLGINELQEILIDDCSTDTENYNNYKIGGYCHIMIGQKVGEKRQYRILRKLGYGQYSTVWLARDTTRHDAYYAIKILRSALQYRESAKQEIRILEHMKSQNPTSVGYNNINYNLNDFEHRSIYGQHICITFEVMDISLRKILEKSDFFRIDQPTARIIFKQALEGLVFLHDTCNIIHTDIKPDNILIVSNNHTFIDNIVGYAERFVELRVPFPKSYVSSCSWKEYIEENGVPTRTNDCEANIATTSDSGLNKKYIISPDVQIKIADFGSSILKGQDHPDVIQATSYRSLEVVIQATYSYPVDMWSLGCTLYEMCVGKILFNFSKNSPCLGIYTKEYHLHLMIQILGDIPRSVLSKGRRNIAGNLNTNIEKTKIQPIEDILIKQYQWDKAEAEIFADLVNKLIEPNPINRFTAAQALQHVWLKM